MLEPATAFLSELRDARFADGLCCAHCRSEQVVRWGGFSGRQRYRCRACGRTFSDLTGTPMAYSKRPELWREYARCMLQSLTVRAIGRRLGIDKDTALRWRHALLDSHRRQPAAPFRGIVEMVERAVAVSHKGERNLPGPHRRGRARRQHGIADPRSVWILFARDRRGSSDVFLTWGRRAGPADVEQLLWPSGRVRMLLGHYGPFGPWGHFGIPRGMAYTRVREGANGRPHDKFYHLQNVLGYERGLRWWLLRFRGVSTRYLPNYMHWYEFLDSLERPATRLLLESTRGLEPKRPRRSRDGP